MYREKVLVVLSRHLLGNIHTNDTDYKSCITVKTRLNPGAYLSEMILRAGLIKSTGPWIC